MELVLRKSAAPADWFYLRRMVTVVTLGHMSSGALDGSVAVQRCQRPFVGIECCHDLIGYEYAALSIL